MGDRLALARAALAKAEEKAGLRLVRANPIASSQGAGHAAISGAVSTDAYTVPEELSAVFPHGILRGSPLDISGSSALPLLLAGIMSRQGAWVAFIGSPNISWAMADHSGIDRGRLMYVPHVPLQGSQVVSAAIDGFDVVVIGGGVRLDRREKKVLDRRARSKNTLVMSHGWEGASLKVGCSLVSIEGISDGRGYISRISYEVESRFGRAVLGYGATGWAGQERHAPGVLRSVPGDERRLA